MCSLDVLLEQHILHWEAIWIYKNVRQFECNLPEKKLDCFEFPFPYAIMHNITSWKSVIIRCLPGNAGEQRHTKMDLELQRDDELIL